MQVVIIQGDALFRSGHSDVNDAYISLIDRIASVMNRLPGDIVVRGYTDSIPINTPLFPSNKALSQARADNLANMIRDRIDDPQRISASGMGDSNPRSPDNPRDPRNRGVEIALKDSDRSGNL